MKKPWILALLIISLAAGGCSRIYPSMKVEVVVGSGSPNCELYQGQRVPVAVIGRLPAGAAVYWKAEGGTVEEGNSLATMFQASEREDIAMIIADIHYQGENYSIPVNCRLVPAPTTTVTDAAAVAGAITETPTGTPSPTPEDPTTDPGNQAPEPNVPMPTLTPTTGNYQVAITEIMANPCGGDKEQLANEYIELYNYGINAVDLEGWFLYATGQYDPPNPITAWDTRNTGTGSLLGEGLITDSTNLQPGHFALILQPQYLLMESKNPQPYHFPQGTLILTLMSGDRLGNKTGGLISSGNMDGRDSIYIYDGDDKTVTTLISHYGISAAGQHPTNWQRAWNLPLEAMRCKAVERKRAASFTSDEKNTWQVINEGTPGEQK